MMHDFNSVSGMWSEMWLKGKGGRRGGEGTNVRGNKDRNRGGRSVRRKEEEEGGRIPPHSLSDRFRMDESQRRGKEGGRWRRGEGRRGGARVAFVCFPRLKAGLEK